MIEFNEKAKEDNPIASILGVNGLKLFTDTILITKIPNPVIIARQKPGKSTLSMMGAMGELGFVEHYPDYLPDDVFEWKKENTTILSTRIYEGWMRLRNWKSMTNFMIAGDPQAEETLFKIIVCNYVAVLDKDKKVVLKHPMTIPTGIAFDDLDEPEEAPPVASWAPPPIGGWAQATLTSEDVFGENGMAPTAVDAG